ncbi:Swt1 family HEPN domain-containing protein [uncultured Cellulomonas sp.]|uniref:Swt1 family HEPN domain-containing protein n=1 Tax=uncultured Cellulomonas sp. TaxID=189682 RepID=UPI0028E40AB5|nr:Swt1 family HEPN domain-containing protein [uncultured Cellulomonas sp.]
MTANPALVRDWLFKGMSAEARLDELESEGVAVRAATDPGALQRVMSLEEFSPEIRRSAMSALPAYLAFFCLENAVRELVEERLRESIGSSWWEDCVSAKIQGKVTERREKEGVNRWHVRRGAQEIYYTDFGDLVAIIRNNWDKFEDLFPDQNWLINRLNELEASRNVIAHSNKLDQREMDRISMYVQDWLRQVG